jgi:uncharacterized membrane protein YcaP (DUF421 family)
MGQLYFQTTRFFREVAMFFDDWFGIVRTLVVGACAYLLVLLLHRISGKRTLSKLNAFDLVVTVSLGSTLATVLLSESVALAEGAAALILLIGLQFVVTWLSVRSKTFSRIIKSEPTLLVRQGELLPEAMKSERVVEAEIRQAVRRAGLPGIKQASAVILETDGSFSVISDDASIGRLPGLTASPDQVAEGGK